MSKMQKNLLTIQNNQCLRRASYLMTSNQKQAKGLRQKIKDYNKSSALFESYNETLST